MGKLYDLESGECLRNFEGPTMWGDAAAVLPDGRRVLSRSSDNALKLWNLETGECLRTFEGHTDWVLAVALLSDGKRAASRSLGNTLKLWNLDDGRCIATWVVDTGTCKSAWLANQGVSSCAAGSNLILAGTWNGDVLFFKPMAPGRVAPETGAATWHPARPLLAVARANGAILVKEWHASSAQLEPLAHSPPFGAPISALRFSLDGTRLQVVTTDNTEHVLDATTLQPVSPPACPWSEPCDLSPDGAWRAVIRDGRLVVEAAKP